jgi:hypothetical protein
VQTVQIRLKYSKKMIKNSKRHSPRIADTETTENEEEEHGEKDDLNHLGDEGKDTSVLRAHAGFEGEFRVERGPGV